MAQAMGFSSFGMKGAKRRKFNPHADDAVIDDGSGLPLQQKSASGSNNTPLGQRRVPASSNDNEIALDDEDEDDVDEGRGSCLGEGVDGADPGPQYIDTSRPATSRVPDAEPSHIDSLTGTLTLPPRPTEAQPVFLGGSSRGGGSFNTTRGGRGAGHGRGHRDDGKPWWEDYYDPTFNVNPWDALEKKMGLEPRGPWLSWEESKGRWEAAKAEVEA
ncbi:uncharacterized protein BCR38DRAFT_490319 [Pseudomassariella vexata]|uniref:Uncharacterized protein n=1 Tax=Pseudomassariella vexata TaxID=1141098 RepID=A0A1Y2DC79_9PEZI|nr:uncharacterized protein BCR38DRAFT_490319 [Pseudomassariella vexata]ORY56871.1 hypothetical protein BCR38DRAFT_490319 [Pseudomassariella vexata]